MKRIYLTLILVLAACSLTHAAGNDKPAENAVEINSFWSNWFLQAGLDMSLQNPYGHSFKHVIPNGKTFGLDVALGKAFTPALTLRGKLNWENGFPLFRNNHALWLAPFYEPGVNMDRGGYICINGDVLLDVQNLFCAYNPERFWNMYAFFRAGGLYNFGAKKGSPLLGLGLGSTFRINDKLKIYYDMAYQWVSSGHVGVEKPTGTGSNSNGFFDFNVGLQINFGQNTFTRVNK